MIYAYGDESVTPEVVAFAVALFPQDRVPEAESALVEAKRHVGVAPEAKLHCRELFNEAARKKTAWANVELKAVWAALRQLCERLARIAHRPLVSIIDRASVPPEAIARESPLGELTEKGLVSLAYFAVQAGLFHKFGVEGGRLWIDPDKTRIPWGAKMRRADSTRAIYADIEPGQEPRLLVPTVSDFPKPRLLEVADLYAYTIRSASTKAAYNADNFRALAAIINPDSWSILLEPNPRWATGESFLERAGTLWRLKKGEEEARCLFSGAAGFWVGVARDDTWMVSEVHESAADALRRAAVVGKELMAAGWSEANG